jgi:hypothetical protein
MSETSQDFKVIVRKYDMKSRCALWTMRGKMAYISKLSSKRLQVNNNTNETRGWRLGSPAKPHLHGLVAVLMAFWLPQAVVVLAGVHTKSNQPYNNLVVDKQPLIQIVQHCISLA